MYIYVISQREERGYDTFDSAVVIAESEEAARQMHPRGEWPSFGWVRQDQVHLVMVERIGTARLGAKPGVVLASFNAG